MYISPPAACLSPRMFCILRCSVHTRLSLSALSLNFGFLTPHPPCKSFTIHLPQLQLSQAITPRWEKVVVSPMNSASLGFFHLISPPICKFHPRLQIKHQHIYHHSGNGLSLSSFSLTSSLSKPILLHATDSNIDASISLPEGAASVMNLEEFIEKDWSVLYSDKSTSEKEFNKHIDRIISAGKIEETSRVLVSISSEGFVDQLVDSSPCKFLLVVHDSLLMLAGIKEKYDQVKCWQGEIIYVPEKWAPLDVVFLYFLPALAFKLDEILGSLAKKISPGGRVVISHPQGREVLEQQRQQHPQVVVSDLPDKTTLQRVAAAHSFDLAEFVDEPDLYLAVLNWSGA